MYISRASLHIYRVSIHGIYVHSHVRLLLLYFVVIIILNFIFIRPMYEIIMYSMYGERCLQL